jgi:hypothetical protein
VTISETAICFERRFWHIQRLCWPVIGPFVPAEFVVVETNWILIQTLKSVASGFFQSILWLFFLLHGAVLCVFEGSLGSDAQLLCS